MSYRLFPLDDMNVNMVITRDADSRFGNRDIWCIQDFIKSDYRIFTIRDHPYHGEPLMMGLSGFRKIMGLHIQESYFNFIKDKSDIDYYQSDQTFAKQVLYYPFQKLCIAYSNFITFPNENYKNISILRENDYDFCGNVYLFDNCGIEYPHFNVNQ